MRQSFQYVAQPRIGLLAVDLGGLGQAVNLRTGGSAFGCVAERQIINGLAQRALRRHLGLCFIQPAFQLSEHQYALFLTTDKALLVASFLEFTLSAPELIGLLIVSAP